MAYRPPHLACLMTETQQRALDFVIEYTSEHGVAPTFQEVADHFNVKRNVAHSWLTQCRKKGFIEWDRWGKRSMKVTL